MTNSELAQQAAAGGVPLLLPDTGAATIPPEVLELFVPHKPQAPDLYSWQAVYADGTSLWEFDRAEGLGWAEVDVARCVATLLLRTSQGVPSHVVTVPPGATPVFFRRRRMTVNLEQLPQQMETVHCLGWEQQPPLQQTEPGQEGAAPRACYLFVFEDGSVLLTSDRQAV